MSAKHCRHLSRRGLLQAGFHAAMAAALPAGRLQAATISEFRLQPRHAQVPMVGELRPATKVWAYDGSIPGPTLRLRQGQPARILVENRLDEDTSVHWHGIRLPNAMDGVPGLTQPPIKPSESFSYEFTPPDAGTFWYHPHANSLQQLGRGLAGALIVEEAEPIAVDRDVLWVISDWRLTADGQLAADFGNAMEAAMAGRIGNTVTINGRLSNSEPVQAGERIRLRLVNTALARIMALHFEDHRPVIVAIDGQPCDPHEPSDERILLGPAMRVDIILDMRGEPGRRYRVIDDFYERQTYWLTHLAYDETSRRPAHKEDFQALPRNPLPEPNLGSALRHELVLQGGMMGRMPMGGIDVHGSGRAAWAINGSAMTGDGHVDMPPQLDLKLGQSCVLALQNDTAWWHPMHLHGFSFKILTRNGVPVPNDEWANTVLLPPEETVEIAFVADNPGNWMLHCHVTDHQTAGLMTVLRVT